MGKGAKEKLQRNYRVIVDLLILNRDAEVMEINCATKLTIIFEEL